MLINAAYNEQCTGFKVQKSTGFKKSMPIKPVLVNLYVDILIFYKCWFMKKDGGSSQIMGRSPIVLMAQESQPSRTVELEFMRGLAGRLMGMGAYTWALT